ncbi:MAG: hypothetical protein ACOYL3_24665 [Desulfuromonadaceae bacterium]
MKHLRSLDIRRIVTGILLLFGLFAVFSCSKTPALAKLPSDGVVLAFGDNLTFGTGVVSAVA